MKMQPILRDIVNQIDKYTIKKFNENVTLIYFYRQEYILKKITIPFTKKTIISQHNFIQYLLEKNIKVVNNLGFIKFKNEIGRI